MRKTQILLAALALCGIALAGIEVLRIPGIEVLSDGSQLVHTESTGQPPGSMVWAVMNMGGGDFTVDMKPVDQTSGLATVRFPMPHPNNKVELRGPGGELLASRYVGLGDTQ